MKLTRPYLPTARKLALPIQRLRSFEFVSFDFGQQIVNKYSSFRSGRFPSIVLTLFNRANGERSILNTLQFLKYQVACFPLYKTQLRLNFDFLFFGNATVQQELEKKRNNQSQRVREKSKSLLEGYRISALQTSPLKNHHSASVEFTSQQQFKSNLKVKLVTHAESVLNLKFIQYIAQNFSQPFLSPSQRAIVQQKTWNHIAVSDTLENFEKWKTNLKFLKQSLNLRKLNLQSSFLGQQPSLFPRNFGEYSQKNKQSKNLPNENINKLGLQNSFVELKKTQISMPLYSANIQSFMSTVRQRFNIVEKQTNFEKSLISKSSKTKLDYSEQLSSAPHHIRRRNNHVRSTPERLILGAQVGNEIANNRFQHRNHQSPEAVAMQWTQPKALTTSIPSNPASQVPIKNGWERSQKTNFDLSSIDVNCLADQVFQVIERKIKIERQRRGIL